MKIEDILSNQDHMNIARKASGSFRGSLSSDEILYCITNAAWNAVKSYDPKKSKLVTFFYRGVRIECLKKIKDIDVDSSQQLNNIAIYIHWRICKLIEEINKG